MNESDPKLADTPDCLTVHPAGGHDSKVLCPGSTLDFPANLLGFPVLVDRANYMKDHIVAFAFVHMIHILLRPNGLADLLASQAPKARRICQSESSHVLYGIINFIKIVSLLCLNDIQYRKNVHFI